MERMAGSATGHREASTVASSCVAVEASTCVGGELWSGATANFTGAVSSSVRDAGESLRNISVDERSHSHDTRMTIRLLHRLRQLLLSLLSF